MIVQELIRSLRSLNSFIFDAAKAQFHVYQALKKDRSERFSRPEVRAVLRLGLRCRPSHYRSMEVSKAMGVSQ